MLGCMAGRFVSMRIPCTGKNRQMNYHSSLNQAVDLEKRNSFW
jgi:hypothetical protein